MKLKNRKTGKIMETDFELSVAIPDDEKLYGNDTYTQIKGYSSIKELSEEWEDVPEEEWRDILGFEGLYQVSSYGNVRTIKRGEVEMSQQENRNGYMTVHLRDKGIERRAMVHRLVAEAFIPNPNELRDVNHKNGDKSDNGVENLEWASHSDNMAHSFRELGKNVRHIVQLDLDNNFIERWNSIVEASEATGICRTNIGECCRGNRKHTKGYKWKYEEDYEEPREYWYIDIDGEINSGDMEDDTVKDMRKIGNYFETKEETERAVEKLKAWKRLKDKGVKIVGWDYSVNVDLNGCAFNGDDFIVGLSAGDINEEDLDLLSRGEE